MVTMAAMNSRTLMDALPRRMMGMSYCQALPCMERPPRPHVQASEYVVAVGMVTVMLLMLTPLLAKCSKINLHNFRSSRSHFANFI